VSDQLNHASIIDAVRVAGTKTNPVFVAHFPCIQNKMIVLPRQARNEYHSKTTQTKKKHYCCSRPRRQEQVRLCALRCEKRHFLSHLYIKTNILPRQARDKHRETTQKRDRFLADMGDLEKKLVAASELQQQPKSNGEQPLILVSYTPHARCASTCGYAFSDSWGLALGLAWGALRLPFSLIASGPLLSAACLNR
jgi:hypothetical protein